MKNKEIYLSIIGGGKVKIDKTSTVAVELQAYEVQIIEEALEALIPKYHGKWGPRENGKYYYAPTPMTKRIEFIQRQLLRAFEETKDAWVYCRDMDSVPKEPGVLRVCYPGGDYYIQFFGEGERQQLLKFVDSKGNEDTFSSLTPEERGNKLDSLYTEEFMRRPSVSLYYRKGG